MGTEKAKQMLKCINGLSRPLYWKKCSETYNNFYAFCSPKLNELDKIAFKILSSPFFCRHICQHITYMTHFKGKSIMGFIFCIFSFLYKFVAKSKGRINIMHSIIYLQCTG